MADIERIEPVADDTPDLSQESWADSILSLFTKPDRPEVVKKPALDFINTINGEIYTGPPVPPPAELLDIFNNPNQLERFTFDFKQKLAVVQTALEIRQLEDDVIRRGSVKQTEDGTWIETDPDTVFPDTFKAKRDRIVAEGRKLATDPKNDGNSLRKAFVLAFTGLGADPDEVDYAANQLVHKVSQGIGKADIRDLSPILTGVTHEKFLETKGKPSSWKNTLLFYIGKIGAAGRADDKGRVLPSPIEFGDGISLKEQVDLRLTMKRLLENEDIPAQQTEEYNAAETKKQTEKLGDFLTLASGVKDDSLVDIFLDGGIRLWENLTTDPRAIEVAKLALPGLRNVKVKAEAERLMQNELQLRKRLQRTLGDEWLAKVAVYTATTVNWAARGTTVAWKQLLNRTDWAKAVATKMATNPGFVSTWAKHQAQTMSFLAFEELIQAPFEFFSKLGLTADRLLQKAEEVSLGAIMLAPITAVTAIGSKVFGRKVSKIAKTEVKAMLQKLGDLGLMSPSEFFAVQDQAAPKFLKMLRGTQLGDKIEAKGFDKMKPLEDLTGFDLLFKAFGGTENQEKALVTTMARNLSLAADQPANYLAHKSSEQLGHIQQNVNNQIMRSNEPGALITKIDTILANPAGVAGSLAESMYLGVGGMAIAPSRMSGKVENILSEVQSPVRRATLRLQHVLKQEYGRIMKGVNSKENLLHAEGYSDQFGVALTREQLATTPYNLGSNDIEQYFKLRKWYGRIWTALNDHANADLTRQSYQAVMKSNLDGHGQQAIVKAIDLHSSISVPGKFADKLTKLPDRVQKRIKEAFEKNELRPGTLMEDLSNGALKFYDVYDVGRGANSGVQWYNPLEIGPIERAVGFNPGFSGGVRYKRTPFSVMGIKIDSLKKQQAGQAEKEPAVVHLWAGRHQAAAQNWMKNDRSATKLQSRGYELVVVNTSEQGKNLYADLPHDLITKVGGLNYTDANILARSLSKTMAWSEDEVSNFIQSIARPALNPFLQQRKKMLKGQNLFGRGRLVYKKDGNHKIRKDLLEIKNPEDAAMDYIQQVGKTLGTGNVRKLLTERITKSHGKFFVGDNIFGELLPANKWSLADQRERVHADGLRQLMLNIYSVPTKTEQRLTNVFFNLSNADVRNNMLDTLVSVGLDEVGLATVNAAQTLKATGSKLIFAFSGSIFTQQLMPILDAVHVNSRLLWLDRLVAKPLKGSPFKPAKVLGHIVDGLNMNPTETAVISADAMKILAGGIKLIGDPKDVTKALKNPRTRAMVVDMDRSFILGEMRALDEFGDITGKVGDAAFMFFFAGEGMARVFSFASARRAMEKEFQFARKAGRLLKGEEINWFNWFDPKALTATKEGMLELQKRTTDLMLNMTREDAPKASRGLLGVFTQYSANINAHLGKKYITGTGFSVGQKARMNLINMLVFGSGAVYALDDILAPVVLMWQAAKRDGKQFEEHRQDVRDFLSGTVASSFGVDKKVAKRLFDGGLIKIIQAQELGADAQHNYATRLYASAIISEYFISNIDRLGEFTEALQQGDVPSALKKATEFAPSTNIIFKNFFETPVNVWDAVVQLNNRVHPEGKMGTLHRAYLEGKEDSVLARELDNVKNQIGNNLPGINRWLSFLDTFGANIVGEEVWRTTNNRPADESNPWSTRWQLLTGLGTDYAGAAREISGMKRDKIDFWFKRGRAINKEMEGGNVDVGQTKINELLQQLGNSDDAIYIGEFLNGLVFDKTMRLMSPKTQYELTKAKAVGRVSSNVLNLDTVNKPSETVNEDQ